MKNSILQFLLIVLILGCSSDDSNNDNTSSTPVLTSIQINSSNGNQLDLNGTNSTTLNVSGFDQFSNVITITGTVQWSTNNNNITINQNGLVDAQSVGQSLVTASIENISETFSITIINTTPQTGTFIYVSDAGNFDNPPWQILKYDENGNNPEVFINQNLAWPQDIVFLENENVVLISNLNSGLINRYNATTGAFIDNFATGISGPTRMKIGTDNLLYVLQWSGNGNVLRYQLDGTFVDEFTNVGVNQSIGLDWDSTGNLYISSFANAHIRKFDTSGNDLGLFVNSNLQGPTDIWFDSNGVLLANDWSGGIVARFDTDGIFIDNFITGLSQPEGVSFLANDNLLIGNGGTGAIKMYDGNGNFIEDIVSAGSGGLIQPNAVKVRVIN